MSYRKLAIERKIVPLVRLQKCNYHFVCTFIGRNGLTYNLPKKLSERGSFASECKVSQRNGKVLRVNAMFFRRTQSFWERIQKFSEGTQKH